MDKIVISIIQDGHGWWRVGTNGSGGGAERGAGCRMGGPGRSV